MPLVSGGGIPTIRRVVNRGLALPALVLLAMAGCQSPAPPIPLKTVIVEEEIRLAAPAPLPLPEVSVPLPAPLPQTPPAAEPASPAPPAWPAAWTNAWIPLESWGQLNGWRRGVRPALTPTSYELHESNRVLAVRIGSRSAWYDGYQCLLGFAPRLINGLPYVHSLDALKMFQALARIGTPLPSPTRTIVLDPGHGGKDCGARSASDGGCEKDFALDWALRLRTLLEPRGWRVALTRSNDIFVPLAERVSLAERLGADVFLSFHFNSGDGNPRLAGLETFCLTPTGMPSSLQRDFEDDPAQKYPNNAFDEQNVRLAFALHRALLQRTGVGDRGVGRARFMSVLRGQNRPAVLIEAGYLSNPVEARKIATPEYRQLLAEAVLAGLE